MSYLEDPDDDFMEPEKCPHGFIVCEICDRKEENVEIDDEE